VQLVGAYLQGDLADPGRLAVDLVAGEQLWPRYGEGDVIVAWAAQRWPLARYFESEVLADLAGADGAWVHGLH
jgi:hypothetical protein